MHEILDILPDSAIVLDLGSAGGSFDAGRIRGKVVRVDLEACDQAPERFVQADAAALPFPAGTFDAIISNHSLEHVSNLRAVLIEIRRVIKPDGALYVAVPDVRTFNDKIYRWLGAGGGHVNSFADDAELCASIVDITGLQHVATRVLFSGFSFLNRRLHRWPRRVYLLGGGYEWTLQLASYVLRNFDRLLATRLSVYGWAFYFGSSPEVDLTPRTNVCVRCGSGHASAWLVQLDLVRRLWPVYYYACPACGAHNLFTRDPEP